MERYRQVEKLTTVDVVNIIAEFSKEIIPNRDYLNELDGKLGDADFGTSISGGFSAVEKIIPELGLVTTGMALGKTGTTLVKSMGGASGPLFGTIFMKAGKELGSKSEVGVQELASMFSASLAGVKALGKANAGDKTLIDALEPATMALEAAATKGSSLKAALSDAYAAAAQGVENTKQLVANRGRAHYVGERGLGHQDPGATAIQMLFKVFADYVK